MTRDTIDKLIITETVFNKYDLVNFQKTWQEPKAQSTIPSP